MRIVTAEYGWDHDVAEGPFAVRHGDRVVVTYSGSAVGPTYAVGAIEARSGTDLLDPGAWTKSPTPVLGTGSGFSHWGPGGVLGIFRPPTRARRPRPRARHARAKNRCR